jgi:protein gp37
MTKTSIEWTDSSWNPLRASVNDGPGVGWACVRVSQGCVNCYAATMNKRLGTGLDYTVPALGKVATYVDQKALAAPLSWRKPRRIFVCSMSDLFGDWVTDSEIESVWDVMVKATWHTFQVLTKRPERMRAWVNKHAESGGLGWPRKHIWIGTSVESQDVYERVGVLVDTPAAVRFLSCEPLLGPLFIEPEHMMGLDWLIVGGESGPHARPMNLDWARSLVAQCRTAPVAAFVKQLGAKPLGRTVVFEQTAPGQHSGGWAAVPIKLRDRKGGDMSEWPDDLRVREWPVSA